MTGERWRYSVKSGLFEHVLAAGAVKLVMSAYSGHGEGLNNSALEREHNVGPIPQGFYRCLALRDGGHLGPAVIPLVPVSTTPGYKLVAGVPTIWERSLFRLHGNAKGGLRESSHGCIVSLEPLGPHKTARAAREYIGTQVDRGTILLEVIA